MNELEIMLNLNRMPALFIGSGFTKRYVNGYFDWDELLKSTAKVIGISEHQYLAMKSRIKESLGEQENILMPEIASELSTLVNSKIENGTFEVETFLDEEDIQYVRDGSSYFKVMISKKLRELTLTTDEKLLKEIIYLKEGIDKVNNIFTTNYDLFLEEHILKDKNFNILEKQHDLYFASSFGIAEVYKIHGSINDPKNIVIDSNDYRKYKDNMNIFVSKLYNVLMERPIIFLGFSMNDKNIQDILENFIKHFDFETLETVSKNMFFVQYKKYETDLIFGKLSFQLTNRTLEMQTITTDDYGLIYEAISKANTSVSVRELKRYKDLIYDILETHEREGSKVFSADAIDINKISSDKLVLGFYPKDYHDLNGVFGVIGIKTARIIEYALFENNKIQFESIVNEWSKENLTKTLNFPTYYLMKNISDDVVIAKAFKENHKHKIEKLIKIKASAEVFKAKHPDYLSIWNKHFTEMTKKDYVIKEVEYTKLLYLIINGEISSKKARPKLQYIFNKNNKIIDATQFRQLVTYLDADFGNQ